MTHDPFRELMTRQELSGALIEERASLAAKAVGAGGVGVMGAYSDLTDTLVTRVFELAVAGADAESPGAGEKARMQMTIAAVGGYGRREMAPFSDVDVAFMVGSGDASVVDSVAKRAFRLLVDVAEDCCLKVGYSYRQVDEVDHLPLETQTALLDARLLAGSASVFESLRNALLSSIVPRAFVTGHIDARTSVGCTPFAVEPEIKEGRGGLRDLHATRWISRVAFGLGTETVWNGLRANGVVSDKEIEAVEAAREFISRTRIALHLVAGRELDSLRPSRHDEVALMLGFDSPAELLAQYYHHAHFISRLFSKVADACIECELTVEPGVVARNGRLRILDRGLISRDRASVVRLFQHTQAYHVRLDRDALDLVGEQADHFSLSPEVAQCFLDILSSPGTASTLRSMSDAGVLQRIAPRFGELMYLTPGDAAHRYTVGEHSLRAVEELESLLASSDPLFADVFSRIQHLDVLFLAVLLHDIGKLDSHGDHSRSGAELAAEFARELGMTDDAVAKVEFLVRNHMKMNETARLRDLQQSETIAAFAAMVGDPQLLDMLFLLTVADSRAVGSGGWSQVQTRFLQELYERARQAIRSPDASGPDLERHRRRVRRELCLANLPPDEVEEHCASMPASYILNTSPEELAAHISSIRTVRSGSVAVELRDEAAGQFTELTVAAPDTPGLLSKIAGVLYALGVDVHAAQIFTRRSVDNIAIDLLYIDFEGRQLAETKKWQVEGELTSVLDGRLSIDDLLQRMRRKEIRKPSAPRIRAVESLSDHQTIIEIRAGDTPGLLYYLTYKLAEQRLNIHSARIATWGHEARDAFYLTDENGQKMTAERIAALSKSL